MTEDSNNAVSSSFLLDDDSRLIMKLFSLLLPLCALIWYFSSKILKSCWSGPVFSVAPAAAFHSLLMTSPSQLIRLMF